jgi:hypothetical protein
MIAKAKDLVEEQRERLRRARQASQKLQAYLRNRALTGLPPQQPTPIDQLETRKMAVTLPNTPMPPSAPRPRITNPLPEAWPGGPGRPEEFLDSEIDFGTVELPAVERYGVQVKTTHELVREEVKRFLREHHRSPDVVLLSPLRLLNVPSRWWPRYLVVFEDGRQTFVALRSMLGLREDEARGLVGIPDKFYL